jgi:hypothetical protein
MSEQTQIVHGQPSWRVATDDIEAFVTRAGGHLGPVTFDRRGRAIQPLSVAPWTADEPGAAGDPLLRVLRGDFFTLPFGSNADPYDGERHPYHGETAQAAWTREAGSRADQLHLSLHTTIRPGRVDKWIRLRPGHPVIYQQHVISGMSGPISLGHHAMLLFPDREGSGVLSTSRIVRGQVYPGDFEPDEGGLSALQPGGEFTSLDRVPMADGGFADLTRYPARRGFEDLAMVVADDSLPFAWTAVTFAEEGHVWFAIRDPRVLRNTVLWISNGGRRYPPWNGRHVNVLGVEDVTAYFHEGVAASAADNALSRIGHPTAVRLDPDRPLSINHIMGVTPVPSGFDEVVAIEPGPVSETVVLRSRGGPTLAVPLDLAFVTSSGDTTCGHSSSAGRDCPWACA